MWVPQGGGFIGTLTVPLSIAPRVLTDGDAQSGTRIPARELAFVPISLLLPGNLYRAKHMCFSVNVADALAVIR